MSFITTKVLPILLFGAALAPAAVIIQFDAPGGNLTASPGQTVGWGFNITSTSNFLVPTAVNFIPFPSSGVFTDLLGPRASFTVGPGPNESPNIIENFSPMLLTGLASFAVNANAAINTLINGTIFIDYDLYNRSPNDPNFNPGTDGVAFGQTVQLDASVLIANSVTSATPEPSTMGMFGIAGIAMAFGLRLKGRFTT